MIACLERVREERSVWRRLVEQDAADLPPRFGNAAYAMARDRGARAARVGRTLDGSEPDGH